MYARLLCWSCGAEREIEIDAPAQFAFEVAGWANDVGWIGATDLNRNRVLVFCSQRCCDAQLTRQKTFRVRPIPVAREAKP